MAKYRRLFWVGVGLLLLNVAFAVAFCLGGYWLSATISVATGSYLAVRLRSQLRFIRCADYCERLNARLAEIQAESTFHERLNEVEAIVDQYEAAVAELKRIRHR